MEEIENKQFLQLLPNMPTNYLTKVELKFYTLQDEDETKLGYKFDNKKKRKTANLYLK